MDRGQYLWLMAACLVLTLPLEVMLGARVWRQPLRLLRAVVPVAAVFSLWDVGAIAHHQWSFTRRYVTGWQLPGRLPVEEVVFFLVIPICALLTFQVVSRVLSPRPGAGEQPRWGRAGR